MNSANQESLPEYKLTRNVVMTFLTKVVTFGFVLISSIIIARVLGPTLQGIFALITVSIVLISNLTDFGLSYTLTVFTAKQKYSIGKLNFIALLGCIIIGIIVFLFLFTLRSYLLNNFLKGLSVKYILVIALLMPLEKYKSYLSSILLGLNKVPLLNFLSLVFNFLNTIGVFIVLVILHQGLEGLIRWFIIFEIISVLIYFLSVNKIENLKFTTNIKMVKELIQFGWKIYIANFASILYVRIDRYIINLYIGPTAIGLYHISKNLIEKLNIIQSSVGFVVTAPAIKEDENKSWEMVSKAIHYNFQIMFIICAFLFIIAPYLIPFLYGEKFIQSISAFRILLIAEVFINCGGGIFAHYISGNLGRPQDPLIIAWISFLCSIPLLIILTKTHGINGAAGATTITYGIAVLLTLSYLKIFRKKSISQIFIPKREDINTYINLAHQLIKSR